jgi:hypothetical protein
MNRKNRLKSPPSCGGDKRNKLKVHDQKPLDKISSERKSKTKTTGGHTDTVSDAKTLASILEDLLIPSEIKDIIFTTLKYVIKRTKILNRRMTHLAKFSRDESINI